MWFEHRGDSVRDATGYNRFYTAGYGYGIHYFYEIACMMKYFRISVC